jgi:molecular chaperone GrpE
MMLDEQQTEPEAEAASSPPDTEGAQPSAAEATAAEPETPAASQEAAPDLAAELAREREKATDYMQRWQRAQADLSNYKRRAEQEREQLQKYGAFPLYLELLKMLDNFQRAFETLPTELREFSWVQGVALSYMQLESMLRMNGVTPFETKAGEPFDPAVHEAVTHEETDAYPDGTITAEYQRGYKLYERVLRPALVRVAKAKSLATEQK